MELALPVTIKGKHDGEVIVFIHGWPDSPEIWKHQVKEFSKTYRCACIHLPYCSNDPLDNDQYSRFGYTLPGLADMALLTVNEKFPDEKVYLVGHDWGAMVSYEMAEVQPSKFKKFVAVDIGPMRPILGLKARWKSVLSCIVMGYYYQFKAMRIFFYSFFFPNFAHNTFLSWIPSFQVKKHPITENPKRYCNPKACFYYYLFQIVLLLEALCFYRLFRHSWNFKVPTQFFWGSTSFHSKAFKKHLDTLPDCGHVQIGKTGKNNEHWCQYLFPEKFNTELRKVLEEIDHENYSKL